MRPTVSGNAHIQKAYDDMQLIIDKEKEKCMDLYGNVTKNDPYLDKKTNTFMCPPIFDTLLCWPPQLPNTTASLPCPKHVHGLIPENYATKWCEANAKWFVKNGTVYTEYGNCYNMSKVTLFRPDLKMTATGTSDIPFQYMHLIQIMSQTGYVISLISLLIAFIIMFKIKKLHCARNILHMNLFASFILRSFTCILQYVLFKDGLGLSKDVMEINGRQYFHVDSTSNNFECKLIVTLVKYFTTANYSWILMEGLYLNNLILRALFTDSNKNLIYYIVFGWGLPVLVVAPWVAARILVEDKFCWTTNDNANVFAILFVPTLVSVLINLVLFVIIAVVLYNKLKSPINEDSRRYLKWAKSTLVLMPLFGVNYAIFIILYVLKLEMVWVICDSLFGSVQGFFVAILYCFLNGEVKAELKPYSDNILYFLATNNVTKYCFPGRKHFLSSTDGRQSVCTTMSCSSLNSNNVNHQHRNGKVSKYDHLSKMKMTILHGDMCNGMRHCTPKAGINGHYVPNLTFIHGKYPMTVTTNLDLSLANDSRPHHYSQNLPTCEEEVSMLEDSTGNDPFNC